MTAEADAGYERMLGRVAKILVILGVVGTAAFTVARGWRYGPDFCWAPRFRAVACGVGRRL